MDGWSLRFPSYLGSYPNRNCIFILFYIHLFVCVFSFSIPGAGFFCSYDGMQDGWMEV
ncbi:hypothetical protein DL95DRAFT_381656, partial [Leptodontidium sp. 2 PMI_412]